jgi:hypothetical protein
MTDPTPQEQTTSLSQSILVMVIGKSGRGKSTAIRTLPPDKTFILNVVGKALPFAGGVHYQENQNMKSTPDATQIMSIMTKLSQAGKAEYIVIDDAHYVMASEFMSKALVKGYDKYSIMANNMWNLLTAASKLRGGLKVFFLTHEEDTGTERKMKTLGRLLDEKITPEGLSTIVLFAETHITEANKRQYYLSTQTDGVTNAKSPMDMFPPQIPNDLKLIADRIDEYYRGVSLSESSLNFDLE